MGYDLGSNALEYKISMNFLVGLWLDNPLAMGGVGNIPPTPFGMFVFLLAVVAIIVTVVVINVKAHHKK